ncbi:MAG: hypothetical protein R3Y35_01170 [Clostridia bacterium]
MIFIFNKCVNSYRRNCSSFGGYLVAFGIGMTASCCCPFTFIMFLSAIIITALGIAVIKR